MPTAPDPAQASPPQRASIKAQRRPPTRIGNFTRDGDAFRGWIATLAVQCRDVRIVPMPVDDPRFASTGGAYLVHAGAAEIGIGLIIPCVDYSALLQLELDDPSFAAPISCRFVPEGDGTYGVIVDPLMTADPDRDSDRRSGVFLAVAAVTLLALLAAPTIWALWWGE